MPTFHDLYDHIYDIDKDYDSEEFFEGVIYPDKINKKSRGIVNNEFIPPLKENKDDVPLTSSDKAEKNKESLELKESKSQKGESDIFIKPTSSKNKNSLYQVSKSGKENNIIWTQ